MRKKKHESPDRPDMRSIRVPRDAADWLFRKSEADGRFMYRILIDALIAHYGRGGIAPWDETTEGESKGSTTPS